MASYVFGKDISFTFYPVDDEGDAVTDVDGNPSIYLFADAPSREQAQDGTSAIGAEITSWTPAGNGFAFTIPAIDDLDPASSVHIERYWLGINYTLESSEQVQTIVLSFDVSRIFGRDQELTVVAADLEIYLSGVDQYIDENAQASIIAQAKEELKADLRSDGWKWAQIREVEKLKYALISKTLELIAIAQIAEGTEGFEDLRDTNAKRYDKFTAAIRLEYDADKDGHADIKTIRRNFIRVMR